MEEVGKTVRQYNTLRRPTASSIDWNQRNGQGKRGNFFLICVYLFIYIHILFIYLHIHPVLSILSEKVDLSGLSYISIGIK